MERSSQRTLILILAGAASIATSSIPASEVQNSADPISVDLTVTDSAELSLKIGLDESRLPRRASFDQSIQVDVDATFTSTQTPPLRLFMTRVEPGSMEPDIETTATFDPALSTGEAGLHASLSSTPILFCEDQKCIATYRLKLERIAPGPMRVQVTITYALFRGARDDSDPLPGADDLQLELLQVDP